MTIAKQDFLGWPNSYRISNGIIDLVMTSDIGPRIMFAGFSGGANHLAIFEEMAGKTGGDEWRPYGGHRLWHAPEILGRTYQPDNSTVTVKNLSDLSVIGYGDESAIGLKKEIEVVLSPDQPCAKLTHRLTNVSQWGIELSPWALSMMAVGGTAIMPLPPRGTHPKDLLPNCRLTLWAYTRMNDPRWTWGEKYVLLRQDPNAKTPQKMGMALTEGWAAYSNKSELFIKYFAFNPQAQYPDQGSSYEAFTNERILEVESLGPLAVLEPGATVEHVEHWVLAKGIPTPKDEIEIDKNVLPLVESGRKMSENL